MIRVGLVLSVLLFFLVACEIDGTRQKETAAFTEDIDVQFLQAYAGRMINSREHGGALTPEYVLEHVQNMESITAEGIARGLDRLSEFRQAVHQFKAELMLRALQPDLVPEINRDGITDEEARAYFEENIHAYSLPDLYEVTLFMARTAEDLADLERLSAEAASSYPDLEIERLDPRPLDRFPPKWRSVLEDLIPGDQGPALSHEDGFLRLRLDHVETERLQDFDARKEYIRNDVLYFRYRKAWQETYDMLRKKHGVRIEPDIAREFTSSFERD